MIIIIIIIIEKKNMYLRSNLHTMNIKHNAYKTTRKKEKTTA